MDAQEEALVTLGNELKKTGYQFTTITPESHRRVFERTKRSFSLKNRSSNFLRNVFGWNECFSHEDMSPDFLSLMKECDVLESRNDGMRSKVRFSTINDDIYIHSAYPTSDSDSVFFGPDTYRFAALIRRELKEKKRLKKCASSISVAAPEPGRSPRFVPMTP